MTDTIQKIAGDMLALAEPLHDPSPEKKRLRALAERLRALSARASADEAVEIIEDAIKLASDGVTFGCPADVADWMRDALTAAPQPAQAGASGGGEPFGYYIETLPPKVWECTFTRAPEIAAMQDAAASGRAKVTPLYTAPASPDTKVENPYEVGSADWQAYSRYLRNRRATPQPAAAQGEDAWAMADAAIAEAYPDWSAKRIPNFGILRGAVARQLHKLLAAAPQPQTPCSDYPNCPNLACPPGCAKPSTPPAHGDGEGVKIDYITAFNFAKDNGLDYNRLCAAVREMVTTRPTPEASELIANWRRQAEYSRGVALQKEREGKNHDWFDACADVFTVCANNLAALALPAQGRGGGR